MASPYRAPPERQQHVLQVGHRDPALGDQAVLDHVQVEHVERVVDALDLPHLRDPRADVARG